MIYAYELSKTNRTEVILSNSEVDFSQLHYNQKIENYLQSIEANKKPALYAKAKQLLMELNTSDAKTIMSLINLHNKTQR